MSQSLLGTTATLAKKKAELAALNNVTLPRVYQQIGKRIAGLPRLPPALASHVERIRQLEAAMAVSPAESGTGSEGGLAAKAKQLAQKAAKATSDAASSLQINSAYTTLGREAVLKYGDQAIPKDMAAELGLLSAKQKELSDEIAALESSHAGGILTPARLVAAGMICGLLLGGFVLWRSVGSLFGGGPAPAGQQPLVPDLPDLGDLAPRSTNRKAKMPDAFADVARDLTNLTDSIRTESHAADQQEIARVVELWNSRVDDLTRPLAEDPQLASLTCDMPEASRRAFNKMSDEANRTLTNLRSRCNEVVQKQAARLRRGSPDTSSDAMEQLRLNCDKEQAKLAAARSDALRSLCEKAKTTIETQQRLAKELEGDYDSAAASWSDKALALPRISDDEAIQKLASPKNAIGWNSRLSNAQDDLTFQVNHLIDQQKAKSAEWAKETASRFTLADDLASFRTEARKSLAAHMDAALLEVKELRASKIAEVVSHHVEAMQEQASRDVAEAAEKARRGRSYEAPADLTDAELIEIIKEAPDITDLGLVRAIHLTDACMPAIASLKNLRGLYLSNRRFHVAENEHITAKGLSLLKGKNLRELTIPDRIFEDDEGFLAYAHIVADIRTCEVYWHDADVLRLDNARVSEGVLERLRDVPNIFGLTLPVRVSDRGLETLQHFPRLQRVDFFLTDKVTDAGIRSLAKCKNLRMIIMWLPDGVVDVHISPEAIKALSGMNLAWFVVPRAMHVEKFFEPVLDTLSSDEVQMWNGQPLELMRRDVELVDPAKAFDRRIAANNPDRRNHEMFSMWRWPCTPIVLKACEGKAGIEELQIKECSVEEDALMSLGRIPDLRKLEITKTNMTGRGLKTLTGAKHLTKVYVFGCPKFDQAGAAALAECDALQELTLIDVPLLKDADLLQFANCKELKRLAVKGSGASKSLLVKLQNLMPECDIAINP